MKKLAILLALAMAFPLVASKDKKHKEKRFDPVLMTAAQAAGRYVGIDPDYVVTLTPGGGTLRNFQRTATLTNLVYEGSKLTATAVYDQGRREPFEATFVNRVKNGETAFGLQVHDANIWVTEQMRLDRLFCRRE